MGASSIIEAEYIDITGRDAWLKTFQSIKEKSEREANDRHFTLEASKHKDNRIYNRYRDVNPYDHSRIHLRRNSSFNYINANLVEHERANRKYILTQGPLEHTVGHYWLMIWEQNSIAILMLNKLIENRQVKCSMYWPRRMNDKIELTDVGLAVEYLKCEDFENFSKRTFRLTDTNSSQSREIIQFHYTTWPDFGIPSSPVAFLQFLKQVRESGALDSNVGPPVVHCSAGIGRSGTFCLVDCCLVLIENDGENRVSVQEVLLELRRCRMGLIQTHDQLFFSYQAIIEGIKRLNNPNRNDDYEEVPVITNEDEEDNDDELAPPPPPPRTLSLTGTNVNSPQPWAPVSASEIENLITINNMVNIENSNQYGSNNVDRPLPPLPKDTSLEKVDESDSDDENGNIEEKRKKDSNSKQLNGDDNDEDVDDEEEEIEDVPDSESDMENDLTERGFNPNNELPPIPGAEKSDTIPNGSTNNDRESPTSTPDGELNVTSEVRRRKRMERQSALTDQIREIKRKQKLSDEKSRSSPKKRRLIIIAGVFIGVLCGVIIYTKFG